MTEPGRDIVCGHAEEGEVCHCEPLLAGGEVIGGVYVSGRVESGSRFRLTVLTENIASALVNHRLQRSLREQAIRDPLTGLFNRRDMEEALTLEIARASRSGAPLSLVMCDVDRWRRWSAPAQRVASSARSLASAPLPAPTSSRCRMAMPAPSNPITTASSFACATNTRAVTTVRIPAAVQAASRFASPAL